MESIFHTKGGCDETSYGTNSSAQRSARELVDYITTGVIVDFYLQERPPCLKIADLGCSTGPNSGSLIKKIIQEIDESCSDASIPPPEVQVFLNDLPTNDFNSIFAEMPSYIRSLSKEGKRDGSSSVFIAGVAGSFYGRLFPSNSLHFAHSSYCMHWLSQVPGGLFDENRNPKEKGKVYISMQSSEAVLTAYLTQFQTDFSSFLKSRSCELVSGGKMVLIMLGRRTDDHSDKGVAFLWDVLDEAFEIMASKGEINREKVDSYKTHYYAPSMLEVQEEVKKEGSFGIEKFRIFEKNDYDNAMKAFEITKAVRAIQESTLVHHFGEWIIEPFFKIYLELLESKTLTYDIHAINFVMVLRKLI